jgi:MFS family permease
MQIRFTGLWRHPDFMKLWAGHTVSEFGTMISLLALPFTAVIFLEASPFEMGLLRASALVPGFLLALLAGVWVDRLRRRPLMIWADLGRAALLVTIPAAAAVGLLRIEQLCVVALLAGALTVLFEIASHSYLPSIVRREELVEGNSKLQASASVAEVAGFGLAGALVQVLTAPIAIVIDAVSFLASALSVALIRKAEPAPPVPERGPSMVREVGEGLRLVIGNPLLAPIAGAAATLGLAQALLGAVFLIFVTRELELAPALQGLIYAIGGISSFVGALLAGRIAGRWGTGPTLLGALVLGALGTLCLPLAGGPLFLVLALLVAQQLLGDGAVTAYQINVVSLRQAITPDRVLGRIGATLRFIDGASMLLGSLIGGLLGELVGLRATLFLAVAVGSAAALWVLLSPLRKVRSPLDLPVVGRVAGGGE